MNNAVGTWTLASQRDFPPSNASLHDDATTSYRFKGPTTITLNGANMTVTGKREDGTVLTSQSMAIPEGVVYVSDDASAGSCPGLQPLDPVQRVLQRHRARQRGLRRPVHLGHLQPERDVRLGQRHRRHR